MHNVSGMRTVVEYELPTVEIRGEQLPETLVDDQEYSDVSFELEGTRIGANKQILAQRCEYFEAMFAMHDRYSHQGLLWFPLRFC